MATYMPYDVSQFDTLGYTPEQAERVRRLARELAQQPRRAFVDLVNEERALVGRIRGAILDCVNRGDRSHAFEVLQKLTLAFVRYEVVDCELAITLDASQRTAPPTVPLTPDARQSAPPMPGRMSLPDLTIRRPHEDWRHG